MSYTSPIYYIMVLVLLVLYYILPKRCRWVVLLAGNIYFYLRLIQSKRQLALFLFSIVISYSFGLILQRLRDSDHAFFKKWVLAFGILLSVLPLLAEKVLDLLYGSLLHRQRISWILPVGLAFYSLQMISYLVDIYRGKVEAQRNPFKYGLFISFFPQIIQGPISRYEQISRDLFEGHDFQSENLMGGIQLVLWGFFLKFMIADRAGVIVDSVFDNPDTYSGTYIWVAGILYSFQLYADFLSCTTLSQGVAQMFGIRLVDNFRRPYFSASVKEFWKRWHMSLSFWLRDYIYIPLGGNRKGNFRKWLNLGITFLVSGLWHGDGFRFLLWGMLHAFYQVAGEVKQLVIAKFHLEKYRINNQSLSLQLRRIGTFFLVMIAWIVFRADSTRIALHMIKSMFTDLNPWILFDDSLLGLGLDWKEWGILLISLMVLYCVSKRQESGVVLRERFAQQGLVFRWAVYLVAIWSIWIFGTYGLGFQAGDFIYGGF